MTNGRRDKLNDSHGRKILWIEPCHFRMDNDLHRMAELEILRQLAKRKYTTYLIVMRSKERAFFHMKNSQVCTISIPLKRVPGISSIMYAVALLFYLPICIISLRPNFVVVVPDVSILSCIPARLLSRAGARVLKARFILDIRSVPVETFGLQGFLQNLRFSVSVLVAKKLFDGMTTITSLMRTEVCSRFDLDPKKVGVWTSGVSTKLFDRRKCVFEGIELKRKLGLSEKFVVFYHGAFTATRGLREVIEGMKMLRSAYPNVVTFFLGTGPAISMLKDRIRELGLQENVVVHNQVDYKHVPAFIEMSDVCIIPLPDHSFWRAQCPLKLLEYLAMEKVVIVTDIPAHRLIIGNRKCGIYISSAEPSEIAESIIHSYHNNEKLEKWGRQGRAIVDEKYTWEKVGTDLENYLTSIGEE